MCLMSEWAMLLTIRIMDGVCRPVWQFVWRRSLLYKENGKYGTKRLGIWIRVGLGMEFYWGFEVLGVIVPYIIWLKHGSTCWLSWLLAYTSPGTTHTFQACVKVVFPVQAQAGWTALPGCGINLLMYTIVKVNTSLLVFIITARSSI